MRKVQIYSRRGCHLCDEALQTLEILQRELGFEIEEIFIDGDSDLEYNVFANHLERSLSFCELNNLIIFG